MRNYFALILFTLFLYACSQNREKVDIYGHRNIQFKQIEVDTLFTRAKEFSEQGFFTLENNDLLYFDNLYVSVLKFDLEGNFISKVFEGNEYNSVNSIIGHQKTSKNSRVIFDSRKMTILDSNWTYRYKKMFDWDDGNDFNTRLNNPKADMSSIYELSIGWPPAQNSGMLLSDESVLLPIECTHPDFNAYMHEEYYREAFAFGGFDLKTGKINFMKGKRSPVYLDYKFIPNYDFYTITDYKGEYLISFAPDSLIWWYDKDFKLKTAFGVAAETMDQNYPLTKGTEALGTFMQDVSDYGYYTYLYYEPKSDLLFRSYFTGEAGDGGLQVYKGNTLVGEFLVPFRFRVFGKEGDYLYADGFVDEENNQLGVYKFKLHEK